MIGVGVTTLNRRDIFNQCIANIRAHTPHARIVVVDDGSDVPVTDAYRHSTPQGIAAAKNRCLQLLEGCDHVFLFDDDCWPIKPNWWKPYIESPYHHLSHQPHTIRNDILLGYDYFTGRYQPGIATRYDDHISVDWGAGVMMYMSSHALTTIGGLRKSFGPYGFEHWEYAIRACNAGLTPKPFLDVQHPHLYAMDAHVTGERSALPKRVRRQASRNRPLFERYTQSRQYVPWRWSTVTPAVCIPWRPQPDRVAAFERAKQFWTEHGHQVIAADSDPTQPFLCNQARNNAVRQADTDIVIIADGDTICENHSQITQAVDAIRDGGADIVWPFRTYRHVTADSLKYPHTASFNIVREYRHGSPGGIIVSSRDAYWDIGGYDEKFIPGAWAWDDTAFMYCAETLLNAQRHSGVVYSFDHSVDNAGKPGRNLDESPNKPRFLLYDFARGKPDVMRALIR